MIVQIYEIQSEAEAQEVVSAGVDHPGLLVGTGEFPREIPIERAQEILASIQAPARKLVLSLSRDLDTIAKIAEQLLPGILHIGTLIEWLSPQDVMSLKREFPQIEFMRSIPVTNEDSIEVARAFAGIADFLLLDTHKIEDNQIGATGTVHDWTISRKIVQSVRIPVILAGGLGPENVRMAIQQVGPAGVDSKTRTDQHGLHRKDLHLVRQFVNAARHPDTNDHRL